MNRTDEKKTGALVARREATPDSDIDVIIFGGDHSIPTDVFAIASDEQRIKKHRDYKKRW